MASEASEDFEGLLNGFLGEVRPLTSLSISPSWLPHRRVLHLR